MTDSYTEIKIGGKLDLSKVNYFIDLIRARVVYIKGCRGLRFLPECGNDILSNVNKHGHLHLVDVESREMGNLERFCRETGLAYDRYYSGSNEDPPFVVRYRSGFEASGSVCLPGQCDSRLVNEIDVDTARRLIENGKTAEGLKLLQQLCPKLPPLPAFSIGT